MVKHFILDDGGIFGFWITLEKKTGFLPEPYFVKNPDYVLYGSKQKSNHFLNRSNILNRSNDTTGSALYETSLSAELLA